jgi:ferric-dicitrate binding protein FerR (iron transport regulator)
MTPVVNHALIVAGDELAAGSRLETGMQGAALLRIGSASARVGAATVVEFAGLGHVRVISGRIYVDAGTTPDSQPLAVATPFGNLSHSGTQYQVEVQPGRFLFASVREGRILLRDYGPTQSIDRGEGLRVSGINHMTRVKVLTYDAQWQWASDFVPEFSIEGQSLSVFLDWFARETGRTLVFISPANRSDTDRTTLNGSISGLTPLQALNAILATTRFQCDLSVPGDIRISVRTSETASMNPNVFVHVASALSFS